MTPQELTPEQSAIVADRARVWETRRFCQVLPSIVKYERGQNVPRESRSGNEADGALAALLRCIIYQLDADLAMVSLLDDHTQYFLVSTRKRKLCTRHALILFVFFLVGS